MVPSSDTDTAAGPAVTVHGLMLIESICMWQTLLHQAEADFVPGSHLDASFASATSCVSL